MIRGERFELDLDSDELAFKEPTKSPFSFVGDVLERKSAASTPPTAPTLKSKTGFPEHNKRNTQSRFKSQRNVPGTLAGSTRPSASAGDRNYATPDATLDPEKAQIDEQNRDVIAGMSDAEIAEAQRDLMSSLDPSFLERLLRRSNIDSGSNEAQTLDEPIPPCKEENESHARSPKAKTVKFDKAEPSKELEPEEDAIVYEHEHHIDEAEAHTDHDHDHDHAAHDGIHFPLPSQPPSLDPNSATFLTDLHEKYFPSLPSDPDKLEWMRVRKSDRSAYNPASTALNPNEIRFSFTGTLLAPRTSAEIPVSAGLHHHGDAPESAGYTIPELAHLSRSTYAAQRCVAFQTLGRILYRLGKGEFGDPGEAGANTVGAEDTFGELARGLWREVDKEHVIAQLIAESEGNGVDGGRHVSAKAYATEAVWLWRKGGGQRWKAD